MRTRTATNYFLVNDEEKFFKLIRNLISDKDIQHMEKDGRHKIGAYGRIDYVIPPEDTEKIRECLKNGGALFERDGSPFKAESFPKDIYDKDGNILYEWKRSCNMNAFYSSIQELLPQSEYFELREIRARELAVVDGTVTVVTKDMIDSCDMCGYSSWKVQQEHWGKEKARILETLPACSMEDIYRLIEQKDMSVYIPDINKKINPYDGDSEWKEWCSKKWWSVNYEGDVEEYLKPMLKLRKILLNLGGCEACFRDVDKDLSAIMTYGQLWTDHPVVMIMGEESRCHANSADIWIQNKETYTQGYGTILCTGYALSTDGFWRQHSWVMQVSEKENVIVETTEPRVAYFGYGMTYEMADAFAFMNY